MQRNSFPIFQSYIATGKLDQIRHIFFFKHWNIVKFEKDSLRPEFQINIYLLWINFENLQIFLTLSFFPSNTSFILRLCIYTECSYLLLQAVPTRLNDYLLEVGKSSGEKAISMRKWDLFYDLKSIWCQLSLRGLRLHKIWENMEMNTIHKLRRLKIE